MLYGLVTPLPSISVLTEEKKPASACLDAEYALRNGAPIRPARLETQSIDPPRCRSMDGSTARVISTEDMKFVRIILKRLFSRY
jgi:hypothetical protein